MGEEYQIFIKEVQEGNPEVCKNVEFPRIDFAEKTLVGTLARNWCRAYFTRDIRIDDRKKMYRYIIEEKLNCIPIIGCVARSCILQPSFNLATMPKMRDGYQMQFEVYENRWR